MLRSTELNPIEEVWAFKKNLLNNNLNKLQQ